MKEIKGSKFILRKLKPIEDKASIFKNINNKDILNKITLEYPYTEENYQSFINHFEKEQNEMNPSSFSFIIDVAGEAVGAISINAGKNLESQHKAEIGYWLGKEYWSQGIVTEAVKLLCDFAFKNLNKIKLTIGFLEDNIASKRVAEKNGFTYEYTKRKESFKDGKYKDLIYFTKFNKKFDD